MSTLQLLTSVIIWGGAILTAWAILAVRLGGRHHLTMEDIPDRGEEIQP